MCAHDLDKRCVYLLDFVRLCKCNLFVFALLSLWLALYTNSYWSVRNPFCQFIVLTLSLVFRLLSVQSPLLGWSLCVFPSLQLAITSV